MAGTILAVSKVTTPPLVRFDVPSLELTASGSIPVDPAMTASAVDPSGEVIAGLVSRNGAVRVFRVDPAGTTEQVGPTLRVDADVRPSIAVTASAVVVADCRSVAVLDVVRHPRWRDVGTGCSAGISPDGREVAFSPDGTSIETCSLECAHRRTLLASGGIDAAADGTEPWRILGPISWGPPGLAFAARSAGETAYFFVDGSGTVATVARFATGNSYRVPAFAWQPEGGLLAILDNTGAGGAVRLFDPATGEQRVIALDPLGLEGLLWSPDGSAVATITSAEALLVVGTDERWRLRVQTTWSDLVAWLG